MEEEEAGGFFPPSLSTARGAKRKRMIIIDRTVGRWRKRLRRLLLLLCIALIESIRKSPLFVFVIDFEDRTNRPPCHFSLIGRRGLPRAAVPSFLVHLPIHIMKFDVT